MCFHPSAANWPCGTSCRARNAWRRCAAPLQFRPSPLFGQTRRRSQWRPASPQRALTHGARVCLVVQAVCTGPRGTVQYGVARASS